MLKSVANALVILGLGATFSLAGTLGIPKDDTNHSDKSVSQAVTQDKHKKEKHDEKEHVAKKTEFKNLPAAAQSAIKKAAGDHKITEIKIERVGGQKLYEAVWQNDKVDHEVLVAADGSVCETERVVKMSDAPAAVQAMAKKHFPQGTKVVVEKKMITVYSLEAMVGDSEKEILLSAIGQPIEINSIAKSDNDDEADSDDESDNDGADKDESDEDNDKAHDDDHGHHKEGGQVKKKDHDHQKKNHKETDDDDK